MSLARSLALNTGYQVAGKIISTAFGVAIVGLMTRELGTAGFGAYSTANAFLQMFALLLDLGLNVTLVALLGEHAGDEKYEKRCLSALFTLRILMAILILGIIAPLVAFTFPYPLELKLAIVALAGSFIFPSLNQVVIGAQQRHLKMAMSSIAENLGRIVSLVGLIVAPMLGWGLVPIMWLITAAALINFASNFWSVRKYAHLAWNWDPEFWKMALHRSWPVGVSIAFGLAYFKADTLILSFVRTQAEVGIYGAAYRVLEILITVPFMYAGVLLPILSNAWAKREKEKFSKLVSASVDAMLLIALPMTVGTWLLGVPIMQAVAGPDFTDSGRVLNILIMATSIIYLNVAFSHAVVALNAQRKMLPVYAVVAVLTVAAYIWLIPTYGMWAAAWLTVISELGITAGNIYFTNKNVAISYKPKATFAAIGACILMAAAVYYVRGQWLPIPILTGAVVYAVALYLLGGVPKELIREVLSSKQVPIAEI